MMALHLNGKNPVNWIINISPHKAQWFFLLLIYSAVTKWIIKKFSHFLAIHFSAPDSSATISWRWYSVSYTKEKLLRISGSKAPDILIETIYSKLCGFHSIVSGKNPLKRRMTFKPSVITYMQKSFLAFARLISHTKLIQFR